jgi:hypothetical protein
MLSEELKRFSFRPAKTDLRALFGRPAGPAEERLVSRDSGRDGSREGAPAIGEVSGTADSPIFQVSLPHSRG